MLRLLAFAARQVVVIAEILFRNRLELFARRVANARRVVDERVDEPLDAMALTVLLPPRGPSLNVRAEILARERAERPPRDLRKIFCAVRHRVNERRHRLRLTELLEHVDHQRTALLLRVRVFDDATELTRHDVAVSAIDRADRD